MSPNSSSDPIPSSFSSSSLSLSSSSSPELLPSLPSIPRICPARALSGSAVSAAVPLRRRRSHPCEVPPASPSSRVFSSCIRRHLSRGNPSRSASALRPSTPLHPYSARLFSPTIPPRSRTAEASTEVWLRLSATRRGSPAARAAAPRLVMRSFWERLRLVRSSIWARWAHPRSPTPPPQSSRDSSAGRAARWRQPWSVTRPEKISRERRWERPRRWRRPSSPMSRLSRLSVSREAMVARWRRPALEMLQ
mmetsp:Transcript_864/g.1922  ORF Transcript_864/g.1922 Transcript_864/m.1922 type:complete len:250 (+) Transcript_864:263-1012(+)